MPSQISLARSTRSFTDCSATTWFSLFLGTLQLNILLDHVGMLSPYCFASENGRNCQSKARFWSYRLKGSCCCHHHRKGCLKCTALLNSTSQTAASNIGEKEVYLQCFIDQTGNLRLTLQSNGDNCSLIVCHTINRQSKQVRLESSIIAWNHVIFITLDFVLSSAFYQYYSPQPKFLSNFFQYMNSNLTLYFDGLILQEKLWMNTHFLLAHF